MLPEVLPDASAVPFPLDQIRRIQIGISRLHYYCTKVISLLAELEHARSQMWQGKCSSGGLNDLVWQLGYSVSSGQRESYARLTARVD